MSEPSTPPQPPPWRHPNPVTRVTAIVVLGLLAAATVTALAILAKAGAHGAVWLWHHV